MRYSRRGYRGRQHRSRRLGDGGKASRVQAVWRQDICALTEPLQNCLLIEENPKLGKIARNVAGCVVAGFSRAERATAGANRPNEPNDIARWSNSVSGPRSPVGPQGIVMLLGVSRRTLRGRSTLKKHSDYMTRNFFFLISRDNPDF